MAGNDQPSLYVCLISSSAKDLALNLMAGASKLGVLSPILRLPASINGYSL